MQVHCVASARNAPRTVRRGGLVEVLGMRDFARLAGSEGKPGWRNHQARTMNGGSEHLNGRTQCIRVEFQTLVTNMRCGNRILKLPSKRVFDLFWLIAQQALAGARRCSP